MTNIIDKIGEQIFNFNFWRTYERPIRKSMKKVGKYMDEAIDTLEQAMAEHNDNEVECVEQPEEPTINQYDDWQSQNEEQQKKIQEQEQTIKAMQSRIDDLEEQLDAAEFKICTTTEQFLRCITKGQETIILEGEIYKMWKRYLRAATKRDTSQTVNMAGNWNVTFGYGDNLVILSVPYRGRNTVGVYRTELDTSAKNIIFYRVE